MRLTKRNRQAITVAAVGAGALMMAWARAARRAYDFTGRSVVITGGSRGLGLVLARELAAIGARLTLVARDEVELQRAAENIRARYPGADVLIVTADVRDRSDAERAVARAVEHYGRVDVVVNNAGIIQVGPLDHMKLEDYEDAMRTHFWGPLYMTLAAVPHMRRQGEGRLVNISSIGGKIAVPHLGPYCASKFALTGLSDSMRIELMKDNIIVTTVCPGLMRTGSPANAMFKGKRRLEYAWFAISDSMPLASISAERAARQILAACRRGDAELIISVQAQMAVIARTLAPELFQDVMALVGQLLPARTGEDGDVAHPGLESTSGWAPSPLTALSDRAARENNELR